MGLVSTVTRPWGLYAALALSVGLFGCVFVLADKLNHAEVALLKQQAQVAAERAQAEHNALVLTQGYRDLEAAMNEAIRKADHDLQSERTSSQRTAAGLRGELDQLRVAAADYAAGGGTGADDTATACRERAAALGRLLVDGVQLQDELAGAAEDHAAGVRALLRGWPDQRTTPAIGLRLLPK